MFWATLKLGVRNLMLHKLRSFLTALGTILGVASVIAMLAVGEGSKRHAVEQIRQLGAANVIVRSMKPRFDEEGDASSQTGTAQRTSRVLTYGLKYEDYQALSGLPTLKSAVPMVLMKKNAQHAGRRVLNARILGTTPKFLTIKGISVARGRFLTEDDLKRGTNVAVLGAGAQRRLFGFSDPLGQSVLLGSNAFRVVGVLRPRLGAVVAGGVDNADLDQDIYIPLTTARQRFGELQVIVRTGGVDFERVELSEITLAVQDERLVSQTAEMARSLLKRHHPHTVDFEVQVPLELLRQAEQEKRVWNLVLGSIAGISLLVGGIGIMNIMLATVTERTREIGIRRALGARRRDIIVQFLLETMVLSTIGGMIGIVVGVGLPWLVTALFGIETYVAWWTVVLAFAISCGTGIVFGVYPAQRAAAMSPIEALRHQ